MTTMTRDEVKKVIGEDLLDELEGSGLYMTRKILDDESLIEFSQEVIFMDESNTKCILQAFYYQDRDDVESCGSLSGLHWEHSEEFTIDIL